MSVRAIQVTSQDHVATLIEDVAAGETVAVGQHSVIAAEAIPKGHKIALSPIAAHDPVTKFGYTIGRASCAISAGQWVHSHNLRTDLENASELKFEPGTRVSLQEDRHYTFDGYQRANGSVGTRNEIWILPTVGCVARTARRIAESVRPGEFPGIDGVHAFAHPYGCSQLGDDLEATRAILAALAMHPNTAGVLIVGLGCENNQISQLVDILPRAARQSVRTLATQLAGDEVAEGLSLVGDLASVGASVRTKTPLNKLVLGVKCGGSDGFSGLTANPLVGRVSDVIAAAGGSVIQSEIPELFGAERSFLNRATDQHVFVRAARLIADFKQYFRDHGEPISENPSPGNIAGGITTLEEKSLGAAQKGGQAPLVDAICYGGRASRPGLTLLEAPGNDAVSSTALVAAGATVLLFTTGRGTPLGFPVPTIKISSNCDLAQRKPGWIDFDAGAALDEGLDALVDPLLRLICSIASGEPAKSERNAEREIAIWKRGVTL